MILSFFKTLIMPAEDLALLILLYFLSNKYNLSEHKILFSKTYYFILHLNYYEEIVYSKITLFSVEGKRGKSSLKC